MDRSAKERLIGAIVLFAAAWLLLPVFLDGPAERDTREDVRELRLPQQGEADESPTSIKRQTVVLEEAGKPAAPIETLQPGVAGAMAAETAPDAASQRLASDAGAGDDGRPVESSGASGTAAATANSSAAETGADATPVGVDPGPAKAEAAPVAAPADTSRETAAPPGDAGTQLWAVQIGSFSDKGNADRLAAELRGAGYPAFLSQVSSGGRTLHRVRVGPQADRDASEAVRRRLSDAGYSGRPVRHP